ncbi:nucleotidyltransferase substrate binding protein [Ectothiorhodospira shaposhnikovii]|uniref:nucleotidyltransferase substrate binding protein n=1 Tax=Ectothiorhodospira shaposhnikovii TaxID=1054 RepID=UPI0039A2AB4E
MDETLDLSPLQNAIISFREAMAIVSDSTWFQSQAPAVRNTLIAGVIQNFEFVYELSIKMLRRQMELEAASPEEIDKSNFRDLLRSGAEKGLIGDVEAWFQYRTLRNITAHTYDQKKAAIILQACQGFLQDAQHLLEQLNARNP